MSSNDWFLNVLSIIEVICLFMEKSETRTNMKKNHAELKPQHSEEKTYKSILVYFFPKID